MAEFDFNYDKDKFEFLSTSKGIFGNKFSFVDASANAVTESITFSFKAKAEGTGNFRISNLKVATANQKIPSYSISNSSTSVTATKKQANTSTNNTTKKPSNSNKKPSNSSNQKDNKQENQIQDTQTPTKNPAPKEIIKIDNQNVKTIKDEKTNVIVKGLPEALEDNVTLEITNLEERYQTLQDILKDVKGRKLFFDIKLLKDNIEVQPNGYITIYIPIPAGYNKEKLEVYYINEQDKTFELQQGEVQGDYYAFTTQNLPTFALVEKEEETIQVSQAEVIEEKSFFEKVGIFFSNVYVLYATIGLLILIIIIEAVMKTGKNKGKRSK